MNRNKNNIPNHVRGNESRGQWEIYSSKHILKRGRLPDSSPACKKLGSHHSTLTSQKLNRLKKMNNTISMRDVRSNNCPPSERDQQAV